MKTPKTTMQTYYEVFPTNYILRKGQTTKTMHPNNEPTMNQQNNKKTKIKNTPNTKQKHPKQ